VGSKLAALALSSTLAWDWRRTCLTRYDWGMSQRPYRILIAKPGLDGHDRGAKVIARALRDAGMEVIYTGLRQTAEMIVNAAIQEDVDAVGLSILSGAHMHYFSEVIKGLREHGAEDIIVFGGGIIPDQDIPKLEALGVSKIFTPGTSTQAVIDYLKSAVQPR
jgi:methylmalonyl-CoA mutase C-terminal domain/subunit